MITVKQKKFIPYNKLDNPSHHIIIYPELFDNITMNSICSVNKKLSNTSLKIGLLQLTGINFDNEKNIIGTSACILCKNKTIIAKNKKTSEKINIKGTIGTVIIFGSFFREEWIYNIPEKSFNLYQQNPLSYIYLSTEHRFKYLTKIKKRLKVIEKLPIWKQCVQKHLNLKTMLGSGSYGNVYLATMDCCKFAVKLSKLKEEALDEPYSRYVTSWYEVLILDEIIKPMIRKSICPNLPLLFDNFTCDNCILTIDNKKEHIPCITTVIELASGDLKKYLKENKPTIDELYSCIFQIMSAIHAIQINGQIMNYDVKKENILYYEVEKGGYWHYQIHGKDFYVPNYGYLFILNDFGISRPMSPKYPLYKTKDELTFRIGSRYAIVKDGKFIPFNTMNEYDGDLKEIKSTQIQWTNDTKSFGAQYRMYRKNNKIIKLKAELPIEFLKKKKISTNITSYNFFMNPEIIPPFEFYNDTQDCIRTIIGGKRTTQKGYHRLYDTIPQKLVTELKEYNGIGESMKDGKFSTDPSQVLAGYFIDNFFTKNTNFNVLPKLGIKLSSYIMS